MCAATGGYLPVFFTYQEFLDLSHAFWNTRGKDKPFESFDDNVDPFYTILWGEAEVINGTLQWCRGGQKVPEEVELWGSLEKPFFLVSYLYASEYFEENALRVIPVTSDILIPKVFCLYPNEVKRDCSNGLRKKKTSIFDSIVVQPEPK
jgi:hypothetical protein